MKSSTIRTMIAAVALAVAAGTASAQTYKAEIPVRFRAADSLMLPGPYEVTLQLGLAGIPMVYIHNLDDNKRVVVAAALGKDAPMAWRAAGKPMFAFECAEGQCALRTLWNGKNISTYAFSSSIGPRGDNKMAELLVVTLNR